MIKLNPGIAIVTAGLIGLVVILAESPSHIGSKIPLALFFVLIMIAGIYIEIKMKDYNEEAYGEFGEGKGLR